MFNGLKRTYKQMVTFTQGKHKAATDVLKMAQNQRVSQGTTPSVRRPAEGRPKRIAETSTSLLTVTPAAAPTILKGPLTTDTENPGVSIPSQSLTGPSSRPIGVRTVDSRQPYRCYLCGQVGHMAPQCLVLTGTQRKIVIRARVLFLDATHGRSHTTDTQTNSDRQVHRHIRVAMLQAICEEINLANDEAGPEAAGAKASLASGSSEKK